VVSVQNYQQATEEGDRENPGAVKVYNLSVSGHPSYSVGGLVVHNCHMIKSNTAIRTKAVKAIAKNVPSVLLLSGTPLLSRPIELFNSLQLMDPVTWGNWYDFTRRYCQGHQTRWGWEAKGASNIEELQKKISRYFLRRTKEEVLPHLPKKIFVDYAVDMNDEHRREYKTAQENFAKYLREYKNRKGTEIARMVQAEKLTKINFLRQITTQGKVATAEELIENVVDSGQKVLVFSCFNEPLETLHKKYKDSSVLLTGKTATEDRRDIIAKFQNDPETKIFFGGIVAAGVGITLTAATTAIFLDYSWNPADHSQAIDRMHRPGATSDSVTIYQLYSRNTIDEFMRKILVRKKKIFDALIEGGRVRKDGSIVDQFIDEIMEEYEETLVS
jgi:SWI/SNF-related matrix-associated actin-dependent regulator 1 of chromatin subfamily A